MYSTSKPHAQGLTSSSRNLGDPFSCPPQNMSVSISYTTENSGLQKQCEAVDGPARMFVVGRR